DLDSSNASRDRCRRGRRCAESRDGRSGSPAACATTRLTPSFRGPRQDEEAGDRARALARPFCGTGALLGCLCGLFTLGVGFAPHWRGLSEHFRVAPILRGLVPTAPVARAPPPAMVRTAQRTRVAASQKWAPAWSPTAPAIRRRAGR